MEHFTLVIISWNTVLVPGRAASLLLHWGRVTHICVSKLTTIGSDNGLSLDRCQAIVWINAWILLIGPRGINSSKIFVEIVTFSFKKMCWKYRLRNGDHFVSASMLFNRSVLHAQSLVTASVHPLAANLPVMISEFKIMLRHKNGGYSHITRVQCPVQSTIR